VINSTFRNWKILSVEVGSRDDPYLDGEKQPGAMPARA
jgi:hypothetical protein